MKFSKEFKVGLLAVVSITILYFGFNFLKGIDLFKTTKNYYALYENIDGLTISNPVIINGLSVGRVSRTQILQKKDNLVLVELSIDSEIELINGTVARLVNTDFLGSKAIELILSELTLGTYQDGDTLKSSVDAGITEFLKQSAGPVADNLGTTISRLNLILENFQGNSEKINSTLENIQSITKNLDKKLPLMQDKLILLFDSLNKNSQKLNEVLIDLKPVLANAAQITDSLKSLELSKTLDKTQLMLDNLNSNLVSLKEGEGSLGKLMKDDSLYIYMSHTARDLDLLLVDFQANPGRYVQFSMFGKKDKSGKKNKEEKE
ncbi:MAG: MCE family protein [Cyclobacteriaceae bacterium]|nr:MCE family protein [Cyclobacteriaceae bacterium]